MKYLETYAELKHLRRRFFATTVNDQEPLTPFSKKLHLQYLIRLWTQLYTPRLIYYIKIKTRTSESAERLQPPGSLDSAKFTANEIQQEKIQLTWHQNILLTIFKLHIILYYIILYHIILYIWYVMYIYNIYNIY